MKERPILFTGDMVRAILADRKTQTRRVVTRLSGKGPVTEFGRSQTAGYDWTFRDKRMLWNDVSTAWVMDRCPYGQPGDLLYVKEGYRIVMPRRTKCEVSVQYAADDRYRTVTLTEAEWAKWNARKNPYRGCPGRFMYKSLARIWLEVVRRWPERVQDITEEGARAEGLGDAYDDWRDEVANVAPGGSSFETCRDWFAQLWDKLHGRGAWEANDFVWVGEFKRAEKP